MLRRPGLTIAVCVLLIAGVIAVLRARGPVVSTTVVARTDIEQRVVASGRVRVVTRIQLSAQVAGRVVAMHAVEGQRVSEGDVLVRLDDAEARAAVTQARAAVGQATARVAQVRDVSAVVTTEASRQAAANLARVEAELARVERLAAAGAVADVDLDEARRAAEIGRAQKTAADAQQRASMAGGVEVDIARSAVAEAEAQLAAAIARFDRMRIVAPHAGVILVRDAEPGDTVLAGTTLLEMAADGVTQLVIEPDERNLAWMHLGQRARASADAYPVDVFDAVVDYIAPAIDRQRGSIEVRLRVDDPPAFVRPDMTVSVDLAVASKRGVLAVPSDAVRDAATADSWVFVVAGGRIRRTPVTVGIRGAGHTEIASGLEEGAEVVLGAATTIDDGQRVRARRVDR